MHAWREYGSRKDGVLRISFDNATSKDKLVKKLISIAKEQHQDYAYIWGYSGLKRIDGKNYIRLHLYTIKIKSDG